MKTYVSVTLMLLIVSSFNCYAWFDETHLAVAKAAGYDKWYNAVGADMVKVKAGDREKYNHFFDNFNDAEVTPEMVLKQAGKYDDPLDTEGHLYGAIITSLRQYEKSKKDNKYAEYHLAFCSHYIGDLSNPLHNVLYDDFNKQHHPANDGIVNAEVMENLDRIKANMPYIKLSKDNFENDLAREIARIANNARQLGHKLQKENRNMTKEEAYKQLGQSASLFHAVLKYLGKVR
jgi:hypothetical protein